MAALAVIRAPKSAACVVVIGVRVAARMVFELAASALFVLVLLPVFLVLGLLQHRHSKIEEELKEEENRTSILVHQREFNEKCCIRCCAAFNFLFKKRLQCQLCKFYVCNSCAIWCEADKSWHCSFCEKQRALKVQSCEWLYENIRQKCQRFGSAKVIKSLCKARQESDSENETDSGYDPSLSVCSRESSLRARKSVQGLFALLSSRPDHQGNYSSFSDFPILKEGESLVLDPQVLEIREHLESLVEQLIGEALDDASLDRLYNHQKSLDVAHQRQRIVAIVREFHSFLLRQNCPVHGTKNSSGDDRIFHVYKGRLCEALAQLSFSLQMAINNQPLEENETPTCVHATLKQIVCEVLQEAMVLPSLEGSELGSIASSAPSTKDELENLHSQSYEDILATAILNKVVEKYQKKKKTKHKNIRELEENSNNNMLPYSVHSEKEIQTDHEDGFVNSSHQRDKMDRGIQSDVNPDSESDDFGSESAGEDFCWADGSNGVQEPIEYTIEEQIEEITTTVEDSDSEEEYKQRHSALQADRRRSVHEPVVTKTLVTRDMGLPELDFLYSGLDFVQTHKVPFPELGLDFIEGEDVNNDNERESVDEEELSNRAITTLISPIETWEENWLFRRKKILSPYGNLAAHLIGDEPVEMLVPNPGESARARIGSKDIDELSELSERNSVASLEFSSSDIESEVDKDEVPAPRQLPNLASWELQQLTGEIVSEFGQKDREYTEDYLSNKQYPVRSRNSSPNKLNDSFIAQNDLSKTDSRYCSETSCDRPVPLPRKNKSSPTPLTSNAITAQFSGDEYLFRARKPRFVPPAARDPPSANLKFITSPSSIVVHAGKAARFRCKIAAPRNSDVVWYFGIEPLQDGDRYQIYNIDDEYFLEVYETNDSDRGTYSCLLYNDDGQTWADFRLNVRGTVCAFSAPEFLVPLTGVEVEENVAVTLSCTVSGYPEPQIFWFRDGQKINFGDSHYIIESLSHGEWALTIPAVVAEDRAEYMVTAINGIGQATTSAYLHTTPSGSKELYQITSKVNNAQHHVHKEAEKMLKSANQLSMLSNQLDHIDNTITSLEVRFQERTWEERMAELQRDTVPLQNLQKSASGALRKATGHALDVITSTERILEPKELQNLTQDTLLPAKPGTIADREHKKWLKATANIPNNPYSPENLTKRAIRSDNIGSSDRKYSSSSSQQSISNDLIITDAPAKIDCGLKSINSTRNLPKSQEHQEARNQEIRNVKEPQKYKRDYYINQELPRKHEMHTSNIQVTPPIHKTKEDLNIVEEKVYVSSGKVNALEDRITKLHNQVSSSYESMPPRKMAELEDKVAYAAAQVSQNEKQVSVVESEVARLQREINSQQKLYNNGIQRHVSHGRPNGNAYSHTTGSLERARSEYSLNSPVSDCGIMSLDRRMSNNSHYSSPNPSESIKSPYGGLATYSVSLEQLCPLSPDSINASLSSSMSCLADRANGSCDSDGGVYVTSNASQEDVPSLPSVKELASRFQAAEDNSWPPTLERRKNVVTVVNIFPQSSSSGKSPKMEARNIILVDKTSTPRPSSRNEVTKHSSCKVDLDGNEQVWDENSSLATSPPSYESELPNVRELSRKFSLEGGSSSDSRLEPERSSASVKRVHSLTARNLTREFREAAKRNIPRQLNRKVSVTVDGESEPSTPSGLVSPDIQPNASSVKINSNKEGHQNGNVPSTQHAVRTFNPGQPTNNSYRWYSPEADCPGYTSDDSTASSNSLPCNRAQRKRVSRSILNRAAYWDRRVEEGLMSDNSLNEDFPAMEYIPN